MMCQAKLMDISQVRTTVSHMVRKQPISHDDVQNARRTLQVLCQEAAEYGLTTADVIRAVLRPGLEKKRGCDCPTCKARRIGSDEEKLLQLTTTVV